MFSTVGIAVGLLLGSMVGFKVLGALVGFKDGANEGEVVGIKGVGTTVGVKVETMGAAWHIDGDKALHAPLYILLFPDIATQSLPTVVTGYGERQKELGKTGTEPS